MRKVYTKKLYYGGHVRENERSSQNISGDLLWQTDDVRREINNTMRKNLVGFGQLLQDASEFVTFVINVCDKQQHCDAKSS